jgi:hypothetical protein
VNRNRNDPAGPGLRAVAARAVGVADLESKLSFSVSGTGIIAMSVWLSFDSVTVRVTLW